MVILVTGANGQVGQSIRLVAKEYPAHSFHFSDSAQGDVTNLSQIRTLFTSIKPDFCINAAAYTAVDKAESETEKAALVNITGAKNLALACHEHDCTLIHISTDFVFDGTKKAPYTEEDEPNPQSVYGKSKLGGELEIQNILKKHIIIRTSWVYSQFGSNFMKTMLRLASERTRISVVNDQIGTPTNAVDLADVILKIIDSQAQNAEFSTQHPYGIYNFSNEGQCSWYEFAKEIFRINKIKIDLQPITTADFPTAATRPRYSVLDKGKIVCDYKITLKPWQDSLKKINE